MEEPYMSEQKAPKVKLNSRQWLAVIVCGMAYNALGIRSIWHATTTLFIKRPTA